MACFEIKSKVEMKIQDVIKKSSDLRPPTSVLRSPRSHAFTLMEMLVVMAVIGLLMGLLFPALMNARERAKITRARAEVNALQQAWQAYWNVYKTFPSFSEMTPDAVLELGGGNTNGIAFMEFDARHETEGFLDPWGVPYRISLSKDAAPQTKWTYKTRVHCVNTARYRY